MWHEKYLTERQKVEPLTKKVTFFDTELEKVRDENRELRFNYEQICVENRAIKNALKKMAKKLFVFASHGLDVEGGMGLDELTPEQRKMINDILKGE